MSRVITGVAVLGATVLGGHLERSTAGSLSASTTVSAIAHGAPDESLVRAIRERELPLVSDFAPPNQQVLLIGDSQPFSYARDLQTSLAQRGWSMSRSTFSGASACDLADNGVSNAADGPSVGIVSFRGNAYTPCMDAVRPNPVAVAYATVRAVTSICGTSGFSVCIVIGQPIERYPSDGIVDTQVLNQGLARYAADHPASVVFIDCGGPVSYADGAFNPETRDIDGVHLNALGRELTANCIVDAAF